MTNNQSAGGRWPWIFASLISLFLLALVGCSKDEMVVKDEIFGPEELHFGALIEAPDDPATRARTGYNIVSYLYGNCDFYITSYGSTEAGQLGKVTSTYEIPSGSEGTISPKRLDAVDGVPQYAKELGWYSRKTDHYFYGWGALRTLFDYTKEYAEALVAEGKLTAEQIENIKFPIEKLDNGDVKINFVDSRLEEKSSETGNWRTSIPASGVGSDLVYLWKNGEVLERLVGACTGPLVYDTNGMYVPLQFRHLVSKIMLSDTFWLTDNSTGSTQTTLKGYITFYGLPNEAILYTNPKDENNNPIAPYVEMKDGPDGWAYDQTKGVKYAIANYRQYYYWESTSSPWYTSYGYYRDAWYISPEVDFDKITFKIELYEYLSDDGKWVPHSKYGKHGAYYGDFKNVTFSRSTTGSNYDDPRNTADKMYDTKVLHAGEYMVLTIRMTEKGNPAVKVTVSDWPSATSRTGSTHVHQGLYDVTEVKDMSTIMNSGSDEDKEEFYDRFGSGRTTADDPEGEYPEYEKDRKVIEIFDDIGTNSYRGSSASSDKVDQLYVDDDYILDGKGHTINCNNSSMSIGNVRDVYLRYYYYYSSNNPPYREYIVYIDKMGQVWLVDPVTYERTPTENNVNDMTKNPMTISLSTGKLS